MKKIVDSIEVTIADVLTNYGNTAYLIKTNAKSFDEVRGTRLWKLWYGENLTDFCVRTLEDEYERCKRNSELLSKFEADLQLLKDSLVEEFNSLERRRTV